MSTPEERERFEAALATTGWRPSLALDWEGKDYESPHTRHALGGFLLAERVVIERCAGVVDKMLSETPMGQRSRREALYWAARNIRDIQPPEKP